MRSQNIQHGQKRRMPWSIRTPIIVICMLLPVLAWELAVWVGAI